MLSIKFNKQQGFTLLEVLVAAVVMISVLAITAASFQSARSNSESAISTLEMLVPLPLISDTIKAQIRANPIDKLNGDGQLNDVVYKWQATSIRFAPPPAGFDAENDIPRRFSPRYRLYLVTLELKRGNKIEHFEFRELSWLPRNTLIEE